jgi:hypothetical protein
MKTAQALIFAVFWALCSSAVAQEGLPPVNSGNGHLDFRTSGLFLTKFVPEPLTGLAWHGSELVGLTNLGTLSLAWISAPLEVDYRLSNPEFDAQHELLLFARDPEETFETLRQFPLNDDSGWKKEVSPENLPAVMTAVYPPTSSFAPETKITIKPTRTDFWPPPIAPSGPGTRPDGSGSIKAVRVINHGLCSQELPLSNILTEVSDGLWTHFQDTITKQSNCIEQIRRWSHTTSFLHQTTDLEPAQFGGFFLNFDFHTHDKHRTITDDNIRFNVDYWFRLRDGRLTVEPTYNQSEVNGGLEKDMLAGFFPGLLTDIGTTIFQESDAQQQYHGFDPIGNQAPIPCMLRGASQDDPTLPADESPGACQKLIDDITGIALPSGATLTPPLSSDEQNTLLQTIRRSDVINGKPIFQNLRCAKFGSVPGEGRCEYVIRAKRLNVFPDTVELVFLDTDREVANPAYPIWLLIRNWISQGLLHHNPLCTRKAVTSSPAHRNFVSVFMGYDHKDSNFTAAQCL